MRKAEEIILKPYITEQSSESIEEGKYTFIVERNATKTEIRQAIEKLFEVKVLKVNTINYQGKMKRLGVHVGRRANWKKAVIKIDTEPKAQVYFDKGGKQVAGGRKYKTSIEDYGYTQ